MKSTEQLHYEIMAKNQTDEGIVRIHSSKAKTLRTYLITVTVSACLPVLDSEGIVSCVSSGLTQPIHEF